MSEVLQARFGDVGGEFTVEPDAHVTFDGERDSVWATVVESGRRFDTGDRSACKPYIEGIRRILGLDNLIESEYLGKK